jgi:periplasmic divalent cation tolerance protein
MARALEVHITAPDAEQAAAMARHLVEERLCACVNIIPGVRSIYTWQGKLNDDAEVLCLVKTRPELLPALMERVRALHPYEVPEILAFEVIDGNPAYLDWLEGATDQRS